MGWPGQFGNPEYDWSFPLKAQTNAPMAQGIPWARCVSCGVVGKAVRINGGL